MLCDRADIVDDMLKLMSRGGGYTTSLTIGSEALWSQYKKILAHVIQTVHFFHSSEKTAE